MVKVNFIISTFIFFIIFYHIICRDALLTKHIRRIAYNTFKTTIFKDFGKLFIPIEGVYFLDSLIIEQVEFLIGVEITTNQRVATFDIVS